MREPGPMLRVPPVLAAVCALIVTITCVPALLDARTEFDFEQRYFMEPGLIAADHAILVTDGDYHLVYTVGYQGQGWGQPGNMVDFGHASSPDLVHWTVHPRLISIEAPGWKERNVWAPHIMSGFSTNFLVFYAGVDSAVTQQIGIAVSPDLFSWEDYAQNPVYRPDTTWALWQPGTWSNCRDPFVTKLLPNFQFAMLTTTSTKPGYLGIPESRGAISLAFAPAFNLGAWQDAGHPLFVNDSYRVLESTYMAERNGTYYLFYNEQGIPGVHYMTSIEQFSGWDKSTARLFEYDGFAAEVFQRQNQWLFARVRDGMWEGLPILGIKVDPLVWQGATPSIGPQNRMLDNWTIVSGNAFDLQPTFGDRPEERTGTPSGIEGFFWIATAEQHAGPLGWGCPECPPDETLTGVLRSHPFAISNDYLTFRIGGKSDADSLYLRMVRINGEELRRATGYNSDVLRDVVWDLRSLQGETVLLEIADLAATGHVNIDWIRETDDPPVTGASATGSGAPMLRVVPLASPGPAPIRLALTLDRDAPLRLTIADVSGRIVRALDLGRVPAGTNAVAWDGLALNGRRAPAGVYFYRLAAPHAEVSGRLVLTP